MVLVAVEELHPGARPALWLVNASGLLKSHAHVREFTRILTHGASRMCVALILRQTSRPMYVRPAAFVRDPSHRANIRPVYPRATRSRESTVRTPRARLDLTGLSSCVVIVGICVGLESLGMHFGMHLMPAHFVNL